MKLVKSYDGYGLDNNGVRAFIEDWGGAPATSPNFRESSGSVVRFAGNRMNPHEFTMVVELDQLNAGVDIDYTRNTILSLLFDETDLDSEHRIDVLMDNGTTRAYRMVVPLELSDLRRTYLKVRFRSSRGEWINTNPQVITSTMSATTTLVPQEIRDTVNHPIPPSASAWPVYKIDWITQRVSSSSSVGWKYEQIWRITNNETAAMRNECIRLNLGDTRSLVSGGKALSSGNDVRIWFNGKELRRDLINWNTRSSMLWVTIDEVPAGSFIDLSMVYGNPSAGSPPRLQEGITRPAFNIFGCNSDEYPIHSSGGTSNTLSISSSPWYTDMWNGAVLTVWDSAGNNEQSKQILSNNSNTLTISGTFSVVPTNTWSYVIHHSSNLRRSYWTKTNSHGSWSHGGALYNMRGGWSLNKGQGRPSVVRFADQVPGAWSRMRVLDNNDRVEQPRYSWIDTGGGDYDAFALFDVRRGQGQARKRVEDGQYDGVMISSVHGWTSLECNYVFYNPIRTSTTPTKGSCNFKIVTMDEGGEDWSDLVVDGTANENYSQRSLTTYNLTADMPRHIGFCLVGRDQDGNDTEITTKLKKDKIANARWGDYLYLEQDTTNWSVSRVQNETEKYDVNVRIRLNGSSAFDDVTLLPASAHGELRFGGDGHRIMLANDELLVYDSKNGGTEIWKSSDNALVRRVPYASRAYAWELGADDQIHKRIKRDAMALRPPREYVSNRNFPGNIDGWTGLWIEESGWTNATASYASVGGYGGLALNISSIDPSGGDGRTWAAAYDPNGRFSVVPRQTYPITGRIRTTDNELVPQMMILFWSGIDGDPLIPGFKWDSSPKTIVADTWTTHQSVVVAPSWARYGYVALGGVNNTLGFGGTPGTVYFDYVTTSDALVVSEPSMGTIKVIVEYEEGWLQ